MSRVSVDTDKLDRLADAVGAKSGVPLKLTIDGMVDAVLSIEDGITPTGTKRITSNGEHDVTEFATAQVDVQPRLQSKTAHPSTTEQAVAADEGYDGLSGVTVEAMSLQDKSATPRKTRQVVTADEPAEVWHVEDSARSFSTSEKVCSFDDDVSAFVGRAVNLVGWVKDFSGERTSSFDASFVWETYWDGGHGNTVQPDSTDAAQYVRLDRGKLYIRLNGYGFGSCEFHLLVDGVYDGLRSVLINAIPPAYVDTSDADAVAADIASGKTAYSGGVKLVGTNPGGATVEPLSVTENGVYTAPTGHAYSPVTVNVEGGGGGGGEGVGTLLTEVSLGHIGTGGTSEEDTGLTVTVSDINNYDMLIFAISRDTVTNNVHLETVTNVFLLASSDINTKDSCGVPGGRFNISRNGTGLVMSKFYGTNYGVFPKNITITDGNMTSKIYARYNSSYTGVINGNYTCRVYGVDLCDMIGIQL